MRRGEDVEGPPIAYRSTLQHSVLGRDRVRSERSHGSERQGFSAVSRGPSVKAQGAIVGTWGGRPSVVPNVFASRAFEDRHRVGPDVFVGSAFGPVARRNGRRRPPPPPP